jgi:hypothetical protein
LHGLKREGRANVERMPYRPYHPLEADYTMVSLAERGNGLRLGCAQCERSKDVPGGELVERYGQAATIQALAERLVCAGCGAKRPVVYAIGFGANRWAGPSDP